MAGLEPANGHPFPPIPMTNLQQQVSLHSAPQQIRHTPSTRVSFSRDSQQNSGTSSPPILTGATARAPQRPSAPQAAPTTAANEPLPAQPRPMQPQPEHP
ncbi:hypothetical protein COLO4_24582 [Corchorus olitorius]|uniref:Uncharacterized protein n=1 Tax=Corchorus olitorius TaxID=93759 RepID=A0A1R3I8Y8_9ROSI|nr:hypothetical protein COLO4_24582 [Corchorus olitorius]